MARSRRKVLLTVAAILAVLAVLVVEFRRTAPVRRSVRTFTGLIAAANRGDLPAARALCTRSYLEAHPLETAPGGGIVGLPRAIHPNFQAWRQGETVWVCPTNRVGPVYRFRDERGRWRFDGLVGLLDASGHVIEALD